VRFHRENVGAHKITILDCLARLRHEVADLLDIGLLVVGQLSFEATQVVLSAFQKLFRRCLIVCGFGMRSERGNPAGT